MDALVPPVGRVTVIVSPGAARTELVGRHGDAWKVRVAAQPEQGRANAEICAWIATTLAVPRSSVAVVAGATSRRKVVEIANLTPHELESRLSEATSGP